MLISILIILAASALLGYRIISAVPPLLHTPLMSGMNALSGITVIGAIAVIMSAPPEAHYWSATALILATINVVGGFWVTERMLRMFKGKKAESEVDAPWQ